MRDRSTHLTPAGNKPERKAVKSGRRRRLGAFIVGLSLLTAACSESETAGPRIEISGTRELHHRHDGFPHYIGHFEAQGTATSIDHPTTAATNGLEWLDGSLYESTGTPGRSTISRTDPDSGEITAETELDEPLVGSGLTEYNGQLYQQIRDSNEVLVYDTATLTQSASLDFGRDGRGLCNSNDRFFVSSNGTGQLVLRDVETLAFEREFTVELAGEELVGLDELECISDQIWAVITDSEDQQRATTVAVINIDTEEVEATVDVSQIVPDEFGNDTRRPINGIALRPEDNSLWLTGQQWPAAFEVDLVPVDVG